MGCVGKPADANFQSKYMAMFAVFSCSLLPHVAELSNNLHTDVKFQKRPMH